MPTTPADEPATTYTLHVHSELKPLQFEWLSRVAGTWPDRLQAGFREFRFGIPAPLVEAAADYAVTQRLRAELETVMLRRLG